MVSLSEVSFSPFRAQVLRTDENSTVQHICSRNNHFPNSHDMNSFSTAVLVRSWALISLKGGLGLNSVSKI